MPKTSPRSKNSSSSSPKRKYNVMEWWNLEEDQEGPKPKKRRTRTWEESFQALQEFRRQHGHCRVPKTYSQDTALGPWCGYQAKTYWQSLSIDQRQRLNDIGFDCDYYITGHNERQWQEMFRRLQEYQQKVGNTRVPALCGPLGNWVKEQRRAKRLKKMREDRKRQLDSLSFEWELFATANPADDDSSGDDESNGQEDNETDHDVEDVDTKNDCVEEQPNDSMGGTTRQDRWDQQWRDSFQKLVQYQKEYGLTRVPKTPEHRLLSTWVKWQRARYREGSLREDRIQRLNSIGFEWRPPRGKIRPLQANIRREEGNDVTGDMYHPKYPIGTTFQKVFRGFSEPFEGRVSGYDGYYYNVTYPADNDQEEMSEQELDALIETDLPTATISKKPPRSSGQTSQEEPKRKPKYRLGTLFKKAFPGHAFPNDPSSLYRGMVIAYDGFFYRARYEDGDEEDLCEQELDRLV